MTVTAARRMRYPMRSIAARPRRAGTAPSSRRSSIVQQWFDRFTTGFARFTGRPAMLLVALALVAFAEGAWIADNDRLEWAAALALASVTILLLPILQATQNRDGAALHEKLDELIKADVTARAALIGLEAAARKRSNSCGTRRAQA